MLPIGTIVMLKGGKKKIMIFGVKYRKIKQNKTEEYDYIAVPYPEGNMGEQYQYLFNKSDIETVYYKGYENEEQENFLKQLEKFNNDRLLKKTQSV